MILRIRSPFYIFFLNPVYVAARSLRSLRSNYTIQIGSNWYMDTGVRDLGVASFKANITWINDIGSKDLSNRPKYAVLNMYIT